MLSSRNLCYFTPFGNDNMAICAKVANTFRLFKELETAFDDCEHSFALIGIKASIGEQLGRYQVWSGNVGAHKTGRGSLDFRLGENSSLENMVLKLVGDLGRTLHDSKRPINLTGSEVDFLRGD